MKFGWIFLLALAVAAGCVKKQTVPIPLPTAYPRPNLPDTVLVDAGNTPLRFAVNRESVVTVPREGWIDISYPTLGATVHVTFTPTNPEDVAKVKENRMERLMLNAGEHPVDLSEYINQAGFDVLTASSEGSLTPFQFLATDDSVWVVSGAVYFGSSQAVNANDSLRPIVNAIRHDLIEGLNSLDYR